MCGIVSHRVDCLIRIVSVFCKCECALACAQPPLRGKKKKNNCGDS